MWGGPTMQLFGVILFVASILGLLYVMAGYPLVLWWMARRARPVLPKPFLCTVTVLLPVRNGAPWVRQKLESILALDYPRDLMKVLVISDGSDDGTDEMVREFAGQGVDLLRIPRGGKARAINAGLERATGEILFFTDVRQTLDPASLRHLVAYFAEPSVGVVSGELVIRDGTTQAEVNTGLYWKYEKWIRSHQSRVDSVPGATGCIYAMRRSLAVPMPANTLLDDVYLPTAAFFKGYRVLWTDGARAFDYPTALDVEYQRKVRTQAGIYQMILFYPALINPFRNRMFIHFCSHKLGRLLLPFLLAGVLAGSFGLPGNWRVLSIGLQGVFYSLVLVDPCIPENTPVKRLTSIARTFVVLVAAALSAASILFRPNKEFWKVSPIRTSGSS
jgi:cellulose synthase/poly-beta-1,6-N-acetylglucosamine synthase-like glycosyltransferase